jgi:uncharacterized protein (TIGR02246 family)
MCRLYASALIVVVGVLGCTPAGQGPLSETERGALADSIKALSAGWRDAGQRADATAILGYYLNAPDAAIARADDQQQTTLGYEAFATGLPVGLRSTKSQSLTVSDQRITVLDRDAAAETAVGTWASTDTTGTIANAHFGYTRVWVRRAGAWKILHSHLALFPLQAPPATRR